MAAQRHQKFLDELKRESKEPPKEPLKDTMETFLDFIVKFQFNGDSAIRKKTKEFLSDKQNRYDLTAHIFDCGGNIVHWLFDKRALSLTMVKYILNFLPEVDFNHKNAKGETPLMKIGGKLYIKFLHSKGARADLKDDRGTTAGSRFASNYNDYSLRAYSQLYPDDFEREKVSLMIQTISDNCPVCFHFLFNQKAHMGISEEIKKVLESAAEESFKKQRTFYHKMLIRAWEYKK